MLNAILIIAVITLIISLVTLNRVFGLKALLTYELSNFEYIIKQRTAAFLDVFKRSQPKNTRP